MRFKIIDASRNCRFKKPYSKAIAVPAGYISIATLYAYSEQAMKDANSLIPAGSRIITQTLDDSPDDFRYRVEFSYPKIIWEVEIGEPKDLLDLFDEVGEFIWWDRDTIMVYDDYVE